MRCGAIPRRNLFSGASTDWCSLGYPLAPGILDALAIVGPENVVRWHRAGFRSFWRWKSRRRSGRPTVPLEIRRLIREMSPANPFWRAHRIHGELLKLGIDVGQTSDRRRADRGRRYCGLSPIECGSGYHGRRLSPLRPEARQARSQLCAVVFGQGRSRPACRRSSNPATSERNAFSSIRDNAFLGRTHLVRRWWASGHVRRCLLTRSAKTVTLQGSVRPRVLSSLL
jgi:hypothetical protein